jgi:uncharacterized protein
VIVAVQTFVLSVPGCSSLKEKRMVVKSLKDRIRHRFNVSVAETGSQDVWSRAEVTVALVSHGRGQADALLDRLDRFVSEDGRVLVTKVHRELL